MNQVTVAACVALLFAGIGWAQDTTKPVQKVQARHGRDVSEADDASGGMKRSSPGRNTVRTAIPKSAGRAISPAIMTTLCA
jgi:hypothetical protein